MNFGKLELHGQSFGILKLVSSYFICYFTVWVLLRTYATSPPRNATGPPPMSLILRWQESKSDSLAWGGGGRPTMPPVGAERSMAPAHMPQGTKLLVTSTVNEYHRHSTSRARDRAGQELSGRLSSDRALRDCFRPRTPRDCRRSRPLPTSPSHIFEPGAPTRIRQLLQLTFHDMSNFEKYILQQILNFLKGH